MENELLTFMHGITDRGSQMLLQKAYKEGTVNNLTQALQELKKFVPTTLKDLDPEMVGQTAPYKKTRGKKTGAYPGIYAAVNSTEKKDNAPEGKAAKAPSQKGKENKGFTDHSSLLRFRKLLPAEKERLDALTSSDCKRVCIDCGATGQLHSEFFGRDTDTT
jgi:hypothetical protein